MIKDAGLWLTILVILSLFIVSSFFAQKYHNELETYIQNAGTIKGSVLYVILTVATVIVAPVTTLPLISVLANAWGSFYVGIMTVIGESLGALLAFYIARKYGRPIAGKLASEKNLKKIEGLIPEKPEHAFFTVVFLRIAIPADILSYALGLFSQIETGTYFFATLIGVIPSAMFFSYTGTLPVRYQIFILAAGLAVVIYLVRFWVKHFVQPRNGLG